MPARSEFQQDDPDFAWEYDEASRKWHWVCINPVRRQSADNFWKKIWEEIHTNDPEWRKEEKKEFSSSVPLYLLRQLQVETAIPNYLESNFGGDILTLLAKKLSVPRSEDPPTEYHLFTDKQGRMHLNIVHNQSSCRMQIQYISKCFDFVDNPDGKIFVDKHAQGSHQQDFIKMKKEDMAAAISQLEQKLINVTVPRIEAEAMYELSFFVRTLNTKKTIGAFKVVFPSENPEGYIKSIPKRWQSTSGNTPCVPIGEQAAYDIYNTQLENALQGVKQLLQRFSAAHNKRQIIML